MYCQKTPENNNNQKNKTKQTKTKETTNHKKSIDVTGNGGLDLDKSKVRI